MSEPLRVNWTTEWPTEPGFYWFYGYPSKWGLAEIVTWRVRTRRVNHTSPLVAQGENELYITAETVGPHRWAKAQLPEPPEGFEGGGT